MTQPYPQAWSKPSSTVWPQATVTSASSTNFIGIMSRTFGTEQCKHDGMPVLAHRDRPVAIDPAGDELGFPGELFTDPLPPGAG